MTEFISQFNFIWGYLNARYKTTRKKQKMIDAQKVEKVETLRRELAKAEAELAQFNSLTEDKRLAIAIHDKQCHWNHTDGCSWFYAKDDVAETWTSEHSHIQYLEKAHNVLAVADYDVALRVMNAL
jgi:hypothetical protein